MVSQGVWPSVATEPPRQLDVELLEVDVAHALQGAGRSWSQPRIQAARRAVQDPGNTARRHDRATETADPKEAGRLADTTPGARRRSGDQEDPGRPRATPPAWRRGTLRSMAIPSRHARLGDRHPGTALRDPVRGRHHAGSSGR